MSGTAIDFSKYESAAPAQIDFSKYESAATPRTWIDSAKDVAKEWWDKVNPVSAVQGLAQAAQHPLDTGSAMLKNQGDLAIKAKQAFDKGNYTEGIQHFLNYLVPVLGPQTDEAGNLAAAGEYAKATGQTLGIATNIAAPELLKNAGIKLPVGQIPERMYQSALKPSTTLPAGQVKSAIATGLEQQIPVSSEGVAKLGSLISDLSDKVKAQIQASSNAGATVNPFKIASRLSDTAQRFATQVTPEADLNAVSETGNEFLRNNPGPIPAAQAQAMKQGTYQQLSNKAYGELASSTVEAQKALARGIKEELEQQFPEIKALNAEQGKMIGLDSVLQRAVQRINNHQLLGIGTPLAAGAGGVLTGSPAGAAAAGAMKLILDNPEVKSKLAIALSQASKGVSIPLANSRIGWYANALGHALPNGKQDQSAP
jgi:F0F1-type ATP synthase membrane subunit c/vacuolar-type H+-ATPase subunit K